MSYFPPYIDADGIHIPTYADVLANLLDSYRAIFGADVNLDESTLDYQLLSIFARVLDDYSTIAVQNYNARNPAYATGDSLDVLMALNGMSRKQASPSYATLTLSGTTGTVIEAGSKAMDDEGHIWITDEDCTLAAPGTGTVAATCETAGAIEAPAGTITSIYSPQVGWTGVTNATAAVIGADQETDDEMRIRRSQALVTQNNGTQEAMARAVLDVDGVTSVHIYANNSGSDMALSEDDDLPAHSICAVISGGENVPVAKALWYAKAPGIGTYGGTSASFVDSFGNTNTVNFVRPSPVAIEVTVSLTPGSGYTASRVSDMITAAIQEDISSLGVGESWKVSLGYKDIYLAYGNEDVPFVLTGITATVGTTDYTDEVPCGYDQKFGTVTVTIDDGST